MSPLKLAADGTLLRDVTDVQQAEREIRRLRDELHASFEHAPIGMAIVAPDGGWLRVNRSLCNLLGYSAEELMSLTFQDLTHPDDLEGDLAQVGQMLTGEITSYSMEKRYIAKDGAIVPVKLSVSLVRDAEGAPLHFVSQIQDWRSEVTRRTLEHELAEARRADSLTALAGGLAHEFNNLLVGVLGHASMARAALEPSEKAYANLLKIEESAHRLAHLTDQILAFTGTTWLQLEEVDLGAHVREAAARVADDVPADVDLRLSHDPATPPVNADATQLMRVTTNLLVNAIEAIDGAGFITLGTGTVTMTRQSLDAVAIGREAEPGLFAFVEVRDTGAGMDQETQRRMFEPFFSTKFTGRGLGLASVDGLIRAHRGAVSVHTHPGDGTRVRVLLPVAA